MSKYKKMLALWYVSVAVLGLVISALTVWVNTLFIFSMVLVPLVWKPWLFYIDARRGTQ